MKGEAVLGVTALSGGGRTIVPRQVLEILRIRYSPGKREKLLWTQQGDEAVVTRGTPQSSFRKTMLSKGETSAVPRHIQKALGLKAKPDGSGRVLWVQRGGTIVARRGSPRTTPTE